MISLFSQKWGNKINEHKIIEYNSLLENGVLLNVTGGEIKDEKSEDERTHLIKREDGPCSGKSPVQ